MTIQNKKINQSSKDETPWSLKEVILIRLWELTWNLTVRWLPKPFYRWYKILLKLFGCKIIGKPYIAPTCKIYAPWLLEINDSSSLGSRVEIYNLGPVKIGKNSVVAQYTYLCNGTHDLSSPILPLQVGEIIIEDNVFIGAKALILPDKKIKEGSVVGAGSVLTKDTEPWGIYAGNPARFIKKRIFKKE